MSLFADVTFLQVALTLVTVAVAERVVIRHLPETLVGPNGLLLTTAE